MAKPFFNEAEDTQARNVNGHTLQFGNLSKVYWPKEGYTKRDFLGS